MPASLTEFKTVLDAALSEHGKRLQQSNEQAQTMWREETRQMFSSLSTLIAAQAKAFEDLSASFTKEREKTALEVVEIRRMITLLDGQVNALKSAFDSLGVQDHVLRDSVSVLAAAIKDIVARMGDKALMRRIMVVESKIEMMATGKGGSAITYGKFKVSENTAKVILFNIFPWILSGIGLTALAAAVAAYYFFLGR